MHACTHASWDPWLRPQRNIPGSRGELPGRGAFLPLLLLLLPPAAADAAAATRIRRPAPSSRPHPGPAPAFAAASLARRKSSFWLSGLLLVLCCSCSGWEVCCVSWKRLLVGERSRCWLSRPADQTWLRPTTPAGRAAGPLDTHTHRTRSKPMRPTDDRRRPHQSINRIDRKNNSPCDNMTHCLLRRRF